MRRLPCVDGCRSRAADVGDDAQQHRHGGEQLDRRGARAQALSVPIATDVSGGLSGRRQMDAQRGLHRAWVSDGAAA